MVQHDTKPVMTAVNWSSTFLHTALPIALTVFVACDGLFSVSDFVNLASHIVFLSQRLEVSNPIRIITLGLRSFIVSLTAVC